MPDNVLQRAASLARLLGDTDEADAFHTADHTHRTGTCVASPAPCAVEQEACVYLAEHTDRPNTVVMHIEPHLPGVCEDSLTRVRRRWREAEQDNAALLELVEQHDRRLAAYAELLGHIWLYVRWRSITRNLTTEQRELWADAIESWKPDPNDPLPSCTPDRWWRDDAPAETCGAVGYWGASNTRYECTKPKGHNDKLHENNSKYPAVVWVGHHPTPAICAECSCAHPFHKTCCSTLDQAADRG